MTAREGKRDWWQDRGEFFFLHRPIKSRQMEVSIDGWNTRDEGSSRACLPFWLHVIYCAGYKFGETLNQGPRSCKKRWTSNAMKLLRFVQKPPYPQLKYLEPRLYSTACFCQN